MSWFHIWKWFLRGFYKHEMLNWYYGMSDGEREVAPWAIQPMQKWWHFRCFPRRYGADHQQFYLEVVGWARRLLSPTQARKLLDRIPESKYIVLKGPHILHLPWDEQEATPSYTHVKNIKYTVNTITIIFKVKTSKYKIHWSFAPEAFLFVTC